MKYFSIDRVFRNESLDATHLAEFHQIEGSVADYNLTLGDLMGMLHEFFSKMGTSCVQMHVIIRCEELCRGINLKLRPSCKKCVKCPWFSLCH